MKILRKNNNKNDETQKTITSHIQHHTVIECSYCLFVVGEYKRRAYKSTKRPFSQLIFSH